jgi:hypothetical protein
MVAGLGTNAIAALTPLFSPLGLEVLQAGGTQTGTQTGPVPDHYVDGGSIGVQMARGDVSMFGFGTVTKTEGTRLCGFGHPMMQAGDTALPAAIPRVMWIYASEQHSFKVGEAAKTLGALVNDRQSAVVVDETKTAPTFPLHLEVKGVNGAPKTTWNVTIGEEKFMSAALSAALNNPWDNVHVDGIQATLELKYERDVYRLRGVDLLDPIVDAGEKARVVLHLRPFSGPEITRSAELAIPPELAGRDVEIEVTPGYEVVPDVAPPENLDQLLANATRATLHAKSAVLQIKMPTQGVVFAGHVAPRLPSFALDALRPTTSDVAPEVIASYVRSVVPVDQYIEGHDKVKIKVRAKLR